MWKRTRRQVVVEGGLVFDYEVSPHRRFLAKIAEQRESAIGNGTPSSASPVDDKPSVQLGSVRAATGDPASSTNSASGAGHYVPFKQSRLKGQTNPLRPPIHVETVLIGRALGQSTGYLSGVGFRVRDDGYVEAEFANGIRKFETYEGFEAAVGILNRKPDKL